MTYKSRTIEQIIEEFGEPPICACDKCQKSKNKYIINSKNYENYKRNNGYPKFIVNHGSGIKQHSKESCNKISQNHADFSGKNNPMYGSHRCGELNPNWQGGITPLIMKIRKSFKYFEWRNFIFKKDNYICQECHKYSKGDIEAHHIKPLSKLIKENNIKSLDDALCCTLLWDLNNGQTLCEKCHNKKPKK